jgi:CHASE3 domain sensor protein/GAF domain-containing protein
MNAPSLIDQSSFRRILARNIKLPLAVGVLTAGVFIALIFYLLSIIGWVEHTERVIANTNDAAKISLDLQSNMRGYLLTGDANYLEALKSADEKMVVRVDTLVDLVQDNPTQVDRFRRIRALQTQWSDFAQRLIAARDEHGDYANMMRSARGSQGFEQMRREFNDALAEEQELLQQRNDKARLVTAWTVGSFLAFSLLVSGFLSYFGRRDLMKLSDTYQDALQRHIEQASLVQQQAWLRSGHAQLAEEMVGQVAPGRLAEKTLEFLARYLDAVVGAFYIREEDGALTRIASYGFALEGAQANQSFYAAEGLLGQAAKQRRVLTLNDIPDDYLKVTTGLGSGKPRNVTLAPVNNDGNVNGVIEMGFLRELSARDVEFLELVANSIGTSVEAARYRLRLQDMLAETQQLNEEMVQQQEELRTSNEELEQQSRALEQSQTLLEERAADLQEASRYKSEFLANMSHELRTPLNSALILAKLLSDNQPGNLSEEQVKFAQTIYSAGNDLLNLINDILDISKVEAGKLELVPESVPVARMLDALRMTFAPMAAQKQLNFHIRIDDDAPASVYTDRQRLEQILRNLMSNAIKFTEQGDITLTVSRAVTGPDGSRMRVAAFALRCRIPVSVFPCISKSVFSRPSSRPTALPAGASAAPAWVCRFRAISAVCWADPSWSTARPAKAAPSRCCCRCNSVINFRAISRWRRPPMWPRRLPLPQQRPVWACRIRCILLCLHPGLALHSHHSIRRQHPRHSPKIATRRSSTTAIRQRSDVAYW